MSCLWQGIGTAANHTHRRNGADFRREKYLGRIAMLPHLKYPNRYGFSSLGSLRRGRTEDRGRRTDFRVRQSHLVSVSCAAASTAIRPTIFPARPPVALDVGCEVGPCGKGDPRALLVSRCLTSSLKLDLISTILRDQIGSYLLPVGTLLSFKPSKEE